MPQKKMRTLRVRGKRGSARRRARSTPARCRPPARPTARTDRSLTRVLFSEFPPLFSQRGVPGAPCEALLAGEERKEEVKEEKKFPQCRERKDAHRSRNRSTERIGLGSRECADFGARITSCPLKVGCRNNRVRMRTPDATPTGGVNRPAVRQTCRRLYRQNENRQMELVPPQ